MNDLAQAWQRGFDAGWDRFIAMFNGTFDPEPPRNPYSAAQEVTDGPQDAADTPDGHGHA